MLPKDGICFWFIFEPIFKNHDFLPKVKENQGPSTNPVYTNPVKSRQHIKTSVLNNTIDYEMKCCLNLRLDFESFWIDLSKNRDFCLNVHFNEKYTENGRYISETSHINYILSLTLFIRVFFKSCYGICYCFNRTLRE